MTTIAIKDGVLAADTKIVEGGVGYPIPNKIHVLPSGLVLAGAGKWEEILKVKWFFSKEEWRKNLDSEAWTDLKLKEFEGYLVVPPEAQVYRLENNSYPDPFVGDFGALGSGWKFALAAMDLGKSAPDAVRLAGKYDINTNEIVTTFSIKDVQEKANKKPRRARAKPLVPEA